MAAACDPLRIELALTNGCVGRVHSKQGLVAFARCSEAYRNGGTRCRRSALDTKVFTSIVWQLLDACHASVDLARECMALFDA